MDYSQSIGLRISKLVEYFADGNNTRFAELIGTNEANIRNYRNGKMMPKYDFIYNTCAKFEINYEWLILGKGEMLSDRIYKHNSNVHNESPTSNAEIAPDIDLTSLYTASKDELIGIIKQLVEVNNRGSVNLEKMIITMDKMAETSDRNSITLSRVVDILYGEEMKGGSQERQANAG